MRTHVVQRGDNLSEIAQRYGFLSWQALYFDPANTGFRRFRPNPDRIYPGDILIVPESSAQDAGSKVHPALKPGFQLAAGKTILDDKCCMLAKTNECKYPGPKLAEGAKAKSQYTCSPGYKKHHWVCTVGTQMIACGECAQGTSCWEGAFECSIWWYLK